MKVTNSLKDLADDGNDERGAADYDKRPLQNLVKAGLEMIEPIQDELVKVICEPSEAGLNELSKTEDDGPDELLRDIAT